MQTYVSKSAGSERLVAGKRPATADSMNCSSLLPASAFYHETVFRKADCACGGGCPSCTSNLSHLKVSQPNDSAEIEADNVADRIMRMPERNLGASNQLIEPPRTRVRAGEIHRQCAAYDKNGEEEEPGEILLRKEVDVPADPPPETPPASGSKQS